MKKPTYKKERKRDISEKANLIKRGKESETKKEIKEEKEKRVENQKEGKPT